MRVLYFARFKQIIGRSEDAIEIPADVKTVAGLLAHLIATDAGCSQAFSNPKLVRVAVNQKESRRRRLQHLGHGDDRRRRIAFSSSARCDTAKRHRPNPV